MIAGQFRHPALFDGLGDDGVRQSGVDADEGPADADHLPRELELPSRVAGRAEPDLRARFVDGKHRARVGAVRRHHPAVFQFDVGQEPLVAADEPAFNQRVGKFHGLNVGVGRPAAKLLMINALGRGGGWK